MAETKELKAWSDALAAQHLPRWNELPDIDLYLDQVLTLLDKYLSPFLPELNDQEHVITSSMINNYVKLHIMPAPVKKRYGRLHMAYLIVIGLLKQVLPITDINLLLEYQIRNDSEEIEFSDTFNRFCAVQEKAFSDMAAQVDKIEDENGLSPLLALETAVLANASKSLAEKLIHFETADE